MEIIKYQRSLIPACDVADLEELERIIDATSHLDKIGAYKIGFSLVARYGLLSVCNTIRDKTDLPIIYDHQKAATDIPEMGPVFAEVCQSSGVDAVILFPQSGPETEKSWIRASMEKGLGVIVGGEMTHRAYLESEGGWIRESAPEEIYRMAIDLGVRDLVVPGNRVERIRHYREMFPDSVFYSPGLISQGGEITDSGRAAGERWHVIVGRAIYNSADMEAAAKKIISQL